MRSDNAHVGIHEMTVTRKTLTEALYGEAPRYSYFNGCSTGGRQGLMEAQRYPADYDGIASGAPAINWARFHVQHLWGPLLMNLEDNPIPACKLNAATTAAIEACDAIDGVEDGLIGDPTRCDYDASSLDWFRYFLTQDPEFDWTTLSRDSYERLFEQSIEQFGLVIGTNNPDLAPFRDRGGLDAVIAWVEDGEPPDSLTAVQTAGRGGGVVRTRPLCPYPEVARYRGRGDTDEAESFTCAAGF